MEPGLRNSGVKPMWIDGTWVCAPTVQSMEVTDPATGGVLCDAGNVVLPANEYEYRTEMLTGLRIGARMMVLLSQ